MSTPSNQDPTSDQTTPKSSLFPSVRPKQRLSIQASMPTFSSFGGPCVQKHGTTVNWSLCYMVDKDGEFAPHKEISELDVIRNPRESLPEAMTRLKPYSLSACRLRVTSSHEMTDLSGVWIKGASRDLILTISHFKKDSEISTGAENTTAEAYSTTLVTDWSPTIKCYLVRDFNDPGGERDFAVFAPCTDMKVQSPTQSVPLESILIEAQSLSGVAISFGYNTMPITLQQGHLDSSIQDCPCIGCWSGSALGVSTTLGVGLPSLNTSALAPDVRSISVGEWKRRQNGEICHTVTGWYGISGAGMYATDDQGQLHLVALFQRGIFEGLDADKNGAVTIPREVRDLLIQEGNVIRLT